MTNRELLIFFLAYISGIGVGLAIWFFMTPKVRMALDPIYALNMSMAKANNQPPKAPHTQELLSTHK